MKQTAVDWLVDQVENFNCMKLGLIPSNIIEKAKQMEKQQISDTWVDSRISDKGDVYLGKQKSFEEYYKETYEANEP